MRKLIICYTCRRHVFQTESACPFCGARFPAPTGRRTSGPWPAVAAAVAVGACGGQVSQQESATDRDASVVETWTDAGQTEADPGDASEAGDASDAGDLDAALFKDVILAVPYLIRR
jgi:hypothetical protein